MQNDFIKQMQEKQLYIFKEFYKVCKINNIKVFLAYGTALGAIRHKGFIPWDDDIDLFVFQYDRIKLQEICKEQLPSDLFYQSVNTDKEYRLAIDRIRLSTTTLIEEREKNRDINHGVFIDIYPLFNCADNIIKFNLQYISRIFYRTFLYDEPSINRGKINTFLSSLVLKLTPNILKKRILKNSDSFVQSKGDNKYYSDFYGVLKQIKYNAKWFKEIKEQPFEKIIAPLPIGADSILKLQYGDYMMLPPLEERVIHHNFSFVDFDNSYSKYKHDMYLKNK